MSRAPSVDPQNAVGGERVVKIHWPADGESPAVNCQVAIRRDSDGMPVVEIIATDSDVEVVTDIGRITHSSTGPCVAPELNVRCPMCGSVEGQPCKRPTRIGAHEGAEPPPHRARFDVAGVPFPEKTT